MKRFLRGTGIVLMYFNGIGFVAILLSLPTFLRGREGSTDNSGMDNDLECSEL